ncbi:MAG: DNA-binding protein [Gammaproteobacteria bacterium]
MDNSAVARISTSKKKALTSSEKAAFSQHFWDAPLDALFDQKTVAVITSHSTSWCENMRWKGGGIPYLKFAHKCLYRKRDVLAWLEKQQIVTATCQYKSG